MDIKIACSSHTQVELDDIVPLHHFKKMSDEGYAHARNSIVELGFSFPLFIYIAPDGAKYAVDGNSRLMVLKRMRDEGFNIPPLPADIIEAKDLVEAKQKLIACESRYADPDAELFTEFLNEDNLIDGVEDFMDIPGLEPMNDEITDFNKKEKKPKLVVCPNCSTQFEA